MLLMMVDRPTVDEKRPLLHWLLQQYPDTPKTRAKQWIQAGRVRIGGVVFRQANHLLDDPGNTLELMQRQSTTLDCGTSWQIHPRLALVYLDSALAVVNKGPGLISIPAPNCEISALSILADFLKGKLKPRDRGKSLPAVYRKLEPLPVHRLDQYTTGLFCMASSAEARTHLIDQVKSHSMGREYIAFVEGRAPNPKGTWRHWLQLNGDGLRQRIVGRGRAAASSDAQEAITHYEVLVEYPLSGAKAVVTKLRLRLETGRKHQIRVQAASEGLPLIGDRTYNPNYRGTSGAAFIAFPRQALHSHVLTLEHPEQPGRKMSWTADLPKDLRELEAALRSRRI
jgi:23S rRNA pseudouridine1911/1915/1917 synthase